MARPVKWRRIEEIPNVPYYVPSDKPLEGTEMVSLLIEEAEAIRLKDSLGLEQEECAKRMEVSRPTFQRILTLARGKIADAVLHGKTIHIDGGNYTKNICEVTCSICNAKWLESFEHIEKIKDEKMECPHCGSSKIECVHQCSTGFCKKNCCERFRKQGRCHNKRCKKTG